MKLWFKKSRRLFALAPILFLVVACSSGAVDDAGDTTPPVDPDTITIADIFVDASSDSINLNETSALTARCMTMTATRYPVFSWGFPQSGVHGFHCA